MAKYEASYTYTDAELLALYREALARLSQHQSYTIMGREFVLADLQYVQDMIQWLESRIAHASGPADNYARLNRPG